MEEKQASLLSNPETAEEEDEEVDGRSIPLHKILNLTEKQLEEDIENKKGTKKYRILLHTTFGEGGGLFIDHWLDFPEDKRRSGDPEVAPYWTGQNRRMLDEGYRVFSFIQHNKKNEDEWLFVSAGEVICAPMGERAAVDVLTEYEPFFGRLVINFKRHARNYNFIFNNFKDSITVKEILPEVFSGETFQGYDSVHLSYKKLDRMFNRKILPTYHDALKAVKGIYCLTDTSTGKLYIGSAYGDEKGVAQRWQTYLKTGGDGNNEELIKLRKNKGDKYFEDNFTFTLLEHFPMSYDTEKIIEREQWWKNCLDTCVEHGYNRN